MTQKLSISSLRPKRKSVHYESFKNCIFEILSGNSSNHLFHGDFDLCGIFCNLLPSSPTNRIMSLPSHCNLFCQKILETDQTRCFILLVMSVGNWLSVSFVRRIKNSLHHESFENWLYSIADRNSSNDFFHDHFDVCGISCKV